MPDSRKLTLPVRWKAVLLAQTDGIADFRFIGLQLRQINSTGSTSGNLGLKHGEGVFGKPPSIFWLEPAAAEAFCRLIEFGCYRFTASNLCNCCCGLNEGSFSFSVMPVHADFIRQ